MSPVRYQSAACGSPLSAPHAFGCCFCLWLLHPLVLQVVEDVSPILPLDLPLALMKPPEACSTADVYRVG